MKDYYIFIIILLIFAVITTVAIVGLHDEIIELKVKIETLEEEKQELDNQIAVLYNQLQDIYRRVNELEEAPTSTPESVVSENSQEPAEVVLGDEYDKSITYIAKTVWGEARGLSATEQAAVIWCILNRVDSDLSYMPDDIISVITQLDNTGNFMFRGYSPNYPVTDEIVELTRDVLTRWLREKNGEENIGRVLPKEYLYFHGDFVTNYFRTEYRGGTIWDWSLESPYT